MKEVTLRISEKRMLFFMELMKQLDFEIVKEETTIPLWQQKQVLNTKQEIKEGKEDLKNWETLKSELFRKYKVK